ncbi:MAG: glutamate--tRNA ligase [Rhodospirillales bacterium]|nr:glutamate--tRNA ligase [Rhodospirillales bacterium]
MTVVTRFAPSPTGYLHIGAARTALFNWLFAKHHARTGEGGRYLLRIEDTDRARSTEAAVKAIVDCLAWLGLDWEGEPVSQFVRAPRHAEVARELLAKGHAYRCFCTPAELTEMREAARKAGKPMRYDGRWRDRDPKEAPAGVEPVIRLKMPQSGDTAVKDLVQGDVKVGNEELDDMVLLRADGTPTYMLAVVVDDHDSAITHVIRGGDHLTNTFRQYQLYKAMDWTVPFFAHIPLIHGADGAKLSKRHGALGIEAYRDMGFLPESMRNYLLRLGWSHGDAEIIPTEQAIEWFDLGSVGRSPARFDLAKLANLNGHYLREMDDARLVALVLPKVQAALSGRLAETAEDRILKGMPGLKARAKTLVELAENAVFYASSRPIAVSESAARLLTPESRSGLTDLHTSLAENSDWSATGLETLARGIAETNGEKLGAIAQPLRAAVTGSTASPPIFEAMAVLGRDETLGRIDDALKGAMTDTKAAAAPRVV